MYEILETVLLQSILGFIITAILLVLKPFTSRKFPAKWQYLVWVTVLVTMIVPVYKLIPEKQVEKMAFIAEGGPAMPAITIFDEDADTQTVTLTEETEKETKITFKEEKQVNVPDLLVVVWLGGVLIFSLSVLISYFNYITKMRRNSSDFFNILFEEVKKELGIRRKIGLRISKDVKSPMLTGVFRPVIYLPEKELPPENLRMVLLHELTHYKRKDLPVKWFSMLVNAIHWFNPLCYILCNNLSSACEFACDIAVTEKMTEADRKIYMKTILDLVEER
ncbi:MAG: M56 family metallopeptidase [Clostridia bacterium]|nr:M56 family metallopeptidase [Clostridia bacterium]